jgi:ATP-dependent Clp protease ATP-binding subunit ClpB
VGKTELARALAEFLFDDPDALLRIDMSEYKESHTASRLMGSPPGYVGYDEGGQLTEAVRRRPYQVILFDELEKAHPEVWNTLLQILEDGRLTDGHGRTVDFRNTVVIMTSNLGNELWMGMKGDFRVARSTMNEILQKHFRPEFLNRIDEIVIFHPLTKEHLREIVDIQLARVEALMRERGYTLEVTPEAREYLAEVGYDPDFGARPLKRAIQKELQDPLALEVLSGNIKPGDLIRVDRGPDGLTFTPIAQGEVLDEDEEVIEGEVIDA